MKAKLSIILSMAIFGTIGIFRKWIPLPSSFVAMSRGAIGALFLGILLVLRKQKPDWKALRKYMGALVLSGVMLGANWILLFEAYNYTTVAVATLCYYFAPMFIILASPLLLKEKLTAKKILCVLVALLGMVLVSGIVGQDNTGEQTLKGVALGVASAALYASIVLLNKKLGGVSAMDRTLTQLGICGIVLLPYVLLTENVPGMQFGGLTVAMLIFVGIVHTGIAYLLYFNALPRVPAQTAAILSYIDPALAVVLSALLLKEPMSLPNGIGAIMILGAAVVSEMPEKTGKKSA